MDYIEYTNEVDNLSESLEDRLFDSFEISDKELQKIYKYYIYGGFRNIKLLEIMNFCSTLFMILFIQIIFRCIDYEGLSHVENSNEEKKYLWDFLKPQLRKIASLEAAVNMAVWDLSTQKQKIPL